ncbi:FAD-binding oxidoreductase [Novosphingobium mangrovi (ex Hu et al. 2023)]|uniref:FAD-binding oxidoreductase n=1 Tax=Novosphingobium mangrovi (ex Hu et al. 2023) TaxID=2930094 RepID=A0ABT0AAI9_9SPHN|nr:FAD-binding oxidoreductase [Novosphingobium mangrovi (ex Hu et al. 2023)]MCJ1960211.1 FAD-binding oxidoreductase [Novosphingobium mangrovi (ex Hu et al. 2023)]
MIGRRPALIAQCRDAADVEAAVRHAAAHAMQAVARCGGHSVSGAALVEGSLLIDLAALKRIEVNAVARTARVGGGVLLGELDAATQVHGLAVTAGVEPQTGVGGLTLGGGIGFLSRQLGLAIDNLIGAEVVLADGRRVEVNAREHPDLFWALRGGGGQFGIVTRFDFELSPVGPEITTAWAFYPLDRAQEVMAFVGGFMRAAAREVGLVPAFMKIPPLPDFPNHLHGKPCLALVALHTGEAQRAARELAPLLEVGELLHGFVTPQPYVDFQKAFANSSPRGGRYYWKSIFADELTPDLVACLADGIATIPGEYTLIFLEALGGAVCDVDISASAFPNRHALYNVGISAGWCDPAEDAAIIAAVREVFARLAPLSDGTVYLNYLDRDEAARAPAGFGPNYERLRAVKARYDPEGRFPGPLSQTT